MEEQFFSFILNNGVAVGVLVWFMFRMEKVINNNTEAIKKVQIAVATCQKK